MLLRTGPWLLLAVLLLVTGAGCAVIELGPDPVEPDAFDDGVPEVPQPAEGEVVPLEVGEAALGGVALFVPVTIDGEGPFSFILDTGATNTAIDAGLAQELGLEETGSEGAVSGVTGGVIGTTVAVDAWQLGDVELDAREIVALELQEGEGAIGVDGLLGGDVLSGFGTVTIDYDDGLLLLAE